jgi:hypothetical protein
MNIRGADMGIDLGVRVGAYAAQVGVRKLRPGKGSGAAGSKHLSGG